MRSVKEMMDAQQFLEKYAKTPIGEIDVERARKVLRRSGFFTKTNKISAKYADLVVPKAKAKRQNNTKNEDK